MYKHIFAAVIIAALTLSACAGNKSADTSKDKELTVGLVQKDIRKGMSGAEVAEALGSPNIVTKDSDDTETWVYDKIASEASYSKKGSFWTLILIGGSRESGSYKSSQRTLTVVIKFDDNSKVKSVSYHSSKF